MDQVNNNCVNISVPMDMLEKVTNYMNVLNVDSAASSGQENVDEDYKINEVVGVCGYREKDDGCEFQLKWKGGGCSWVADEDCTCEFLINKYLHSIGIRTYYLVCRVSTKEQTGDTHTSLEAQEAEIRNYIAMNDMDYTTRVKVVKISASAYKSIPRELEIIAEACSMDDSIYIYRADRLSRNIVKYLEWLEYFEGVGVKVVAVSEGLTYRDNKLEFIKAVVSAQEESELIGKRVKLSYKHRRERGDTHVGALPYGKKYKVIRHNGKIVRKCVTEHHYETEIISFIKNSRTDCKTLMHDLNAKNIKKRGRVWTLKMVQSVKKS